MTLTPAYGRDYSSKAAVVKDFVANKDFIIADAISRWSGKPVNREQLTKGQTVTFRYAKLRKVFTYTV